MKYLFSFFVYINMVVVFFVVGLPLSFFLSILPASCYKKGGFIYWLLDLFYKSGLAAFLVPVSFYKTSSLPKKPAVFIANHQSLLDIFLLGALMNREPHIWYALSYYAHMPLFGFLIRNLVFAVNPARPAEAAKGFLKGFRYAGRTGKHIILFPEGGRFNDGSIHLFRRGFALAARTLERPVVPVFMPCNGAVYHPSFWRVSYGRLSVFIGPEFFVSVDQTDDDFVQRLYNWFVLQNELFEGTTSK